MMNMSAASVPEAAPIIRVRGLTVCFGDRAVLENLDLDVKPGQVLGIVGASGTGKSVLLRTILGLVPRQRGTVEVFGINLNDKERNLRDLVEKRWGILFQHGALFSSLTVRQNVQVPMREYYPEIDETLLAELADLKIRLVGLPYDAGDKFPSELSGGMIKRAGIARALALDPDILFLDEPTSGLDPISAAEFDQLIKDLQQTLGLTVFMVSHDLDSLATICDAIAVIGDKKVLVQGTLHDMLTFNHPWVKAYFAGPRARGIEMAVKRQA